MNGFALAYIALASRDVAAASRLLGDLLGLPRVEHRFDRQTVPVFAIGETALALFAPDDPYLGAGARAGVHHVALATADPPAMAATLAAAGFATTAAPGDTIALDPAEMAGVRVRLAPALGLGTGGSAALDRIDHIGIASADNAAALAVFCDRLGCPLESQQTDIETHIAIESFTSDRHGVVAHARPPVITGGLRVAFVTTGDCELEFLQNFDPNQAGEVQRGSAGTTRQDQGAIARSIAARGPGLHHVAFRIGDIDATLAALGQAGVPRIDARGRPGSRRARIGFLHPDAMGGVLIHFVERA